MTLFIPLAIGVLLVALYLAVRLAIAIYSRPLFARLHKLIDELAERMVTEKDKEVLAALLSWLGRWQVAAFLTFIFAAIVAVWPILALLKNRIKESPVPDTSGEVSSFQEAFKVDPTGSPVWDHPRRAELIMLGLPCTVLMHPGIVLALLFVFSPFLLFGIVSLIFFRAFQKYSAILGGPYVWRSLSRLNARFL